MKLKKFLALTCSTLLLSSLFLGCGPKKDEEATQDKNSNVLYVYNWGDYIDPELLTKFKEETGLTHPNYIVNKRLLMAPTQPGITRWKRRPL